MIGPLAFAQAPRPQRKIDTWLAPLQARQIEDRYAQTGKDFDEALQRLDQAMARFDEEVTNLQQMRDDLRGQQ